MNIDGKYRAQGGGGGAKVSLILAGVMALLFIIDTLLQGVSLYKYTCFTVDEAVHSGQVWRFLTAPFFHESGGQVLGSVLFVILIAPMAEMIMTRKNYIMLLALSVIAVPVFVTLFSLTGLTRFASATYISGGMGIAFGAATILYRTSGDKLITLAILGKTFKLKNIILTYVGVWLLVIIVDSLSPELGGPYLFKNLSSAASVVAGWWMTRKGRSLKKKKKRTQSSGTEKQYKSKLGPRSKVSRKDSQVDLILDKISAEGSQSLTKKEREILEEASKNNE